MEIVAQWCHKRSFYINYS